MRLTLLVAVSTLALAATAANAQNVRPVGVQATFTPDPVPAEEPVAEPAAEPAAPAATATADGYTDAELKSFADAMEAIRTVQADPAADQAAGMAAAVQASGLDVERFNAISTAVSQDAVLRARVAVAAAPAPAPGSVAASISEQELNQFAAAMEAVRGVQADPAADQAAGMAAAVQASGLDIERFNAISTAVSQDAGLRARAELAAARQAEL